MKNGFDLEREILYKFLLPYIYKKHAKKPIDPKKVIFANERAHTLPDNMIPVEKEFRKRGFDTLVMLGDPVHKGIKGKLKRLKYYLDFTREYATARFVFYSEHMFPAYANFPRQGTRTIQLWHGSGKMKKIGYSTLDTSWGISRATAERYPMHNTYTDAVICDPKLEDVYLDAWNCDPAILRPFGLPRTDVYFDQNFVSESREKVLSMFPRIGDRKIILYAPTYRGNSLSSSYITNRMNYEKLASSLGDNYVLLNKLHPQVAKGFSLSEAEKEKFGDFVFDISRSVPIDVAMSAADLLITDYSSVMFEYALLGRPMVFYAYDLEEYDRDRSFYAPYETIVPGPIVKDNEELINAVRQLEKTFDPDIMKKFCDTYMSACDGHATQRLISFLLDQ